MRDFHSIIKDKGIPWVRHWIQASHEWSKNFIDEYGVVDFEALGREEFEFREALYNKDFSSNKRAEYLWNEALKTHDRQTANGKKGGRPKKLTQDAPNGNAGVDGKSSTSCTQFTADGDTREGSQNISDTRKGGNRESGKSANNSAATRYARPSIGDDNTADTAPDRGPKSGNLSGADAVNGNATGNVSSTRKGVALELSPSAPTDTLDCLPGRFGAHQNPAETAPSHGGSVATFNNDQVPYHVSTNNHGGGNLYAKAVAVPTTRAPSTPATDGKNLKKRPAPTPSDFEMYDFVASEGLDEFDAREWFEMSLSRGWTDRNGNDIANWKGAVKRYCEAKARKRKENGR